jgi:hypothetical protein
MSSLTRKKRKYERFPDDVSPEEKERLKRERNAKRMANRRAIEASASRDFAGDDDRTRCIYVIKGLYSENSAFNKILEEVERKLALRFGTSSDAYLNKDAFEKDIQSRIKDLEYAYYPALSGDPSVLLKRFDDAVLHLGDFASEKSAKKKDEKEETEEDENELDSTPVVDTVLEESCLYGDGEGEIKSPSSSDDEISELKKRVDVLEQQLSDIQYNLKLYIGDRVFTANNNNKRQKLDQL